MKNGTTHVNLLFHLGIVYDLIECLASQMEIAGLANVPLFFVSPVADSSLAYANIMAEWLSGNKQSRVYLPEEPFPHGNLVKCGRLKSFKNLYNENFSSEYRQPCVMFAGHPSLRFGEAIHFIELWGNNPNNTIVFTGSYHSTYLRVQIILSFLRTQLFLLGGSGPFSTFANEDSKLPN